MPFGGYEDFDSCTAQNKDKGNADAYCGSIKHKVEDTVNEGMDIPPATGGQPQNPNAQSCEICGQAPHAPSDHPYLPAMNEGGMGSGPQGMSPGNVGAGAPGPLMTFEVVGMPDPKKGVGMGGLEEVVGMPDPKKGVGMGGWEETTSIPGSLSGVNIGAKKVNETLTRQIMQAKVEECPCKRKAKNR